MTSALSKEEIVNRQLTLTDAAIEEIERLYASGELGQGYRTVAQCYVCCEQESRELVNRLIACGLTNREITETCNFINNRRRDAGDSRIINAKSIWNHKRNHFDQSFVREIIERNAAKANIDHVNGIGHAITPYAVQETVMVKGFTQMMGENRAVSIKEMMDASKQYYEMTTRDAGQRKMADLMYRMDRILTAIWNVVPQEYHSEILRVVEGGDGRQPMEKAIDAVHEQASKAVREFTPQMKMDENDAL